MSKTNKRDKNYFCGVLKKNFRIYIIFIIIGVLLSGLSFINKNCNWCILSGSLGTSLIGAILLGWFIDASNTTRFKKRLEYIKNREIRGIFWGVKELFRLLYNEYLLISKQNITEGTEIKVRDAIEKMYNYYNTRFRVIDTNSNIHNKIINLKKDLAKTVQNTILVDKRYFLDDDILTEDEYADMVSLYDFLLESSDDLFTFDDYKSIINDTYSELQKINDYFFKISKNNRVVICSPEELKTTQK